MGMRLFLSRLASAQTRGAAARGLAVVCGIGFLGTLVVLAAQGRLERWFFALLAWALFGYTPLRILLEAAGTLAPALRRRLAVEAEANGARAHSAAGVELNVDRVLEQQVVMPRIATPLQREKARDAALAILRALRGNSGGLPSAVAAALGCVDRWVTEIGPWAQREAGQNIQARWREVRALAAMAGMTRVLLELAPGPAGPARDGHDHSAPDPRSRREFLDACLDYCDELALEIDVQPWTETALSLSISPVHAAALREAWRTYSDTGPPALEARRAFVNLVVQPREAG
jgi:hypothetical protein